MHIFYDYQIFSLQNVGGISRYFIELAQRLPGCVPAIQTTILAPVHINEYLDTALLHKIGVKIPCFPGKHRVLPVVNRIAGQVLMKGYHPDILHETYYATDSLAVHAPHVLTVYDMIHERYPHQFKGPDCLIPQLKAQAVARADHLIAISTATRDDLITFLGVPPEKISVIPLASSLKKPEVVAEKGSRQRPYLLYVGLRGGVKNFRTLVAAFSHSTILRSEFDLLCVGGGAFTSEEIQSFTECGIGPQVRHRSADDTELASLYAGAVLFVYPSLYEGFGLPLLEAMRCGCPIACGNSSSMPEVAGDAACYFNPADEEEMRVVLESMVQSAETTGVLRQRGYEREKIFSWESCVSQTAALYRRMRGK